MGDIHSHQPAQAQLRQRLSRGLSNTVRQWRDELLPAYPPDVVARCIHTLLYHDDDFDVCSLSPCTPQPEEYPNGQVRR